MVIKKHCPVLQRKIFWRRKAYKVLKQLEELKQYPPRLTLEITRTQKVRENLKTDVLVNGVKPELKIELIAPCPSGIFTACIYMSCIQPHA